MILRDASKLKEMERHYPWYVETRPHQVKRLGFEPRGGWAVGPTPERRVRWLFEDINDWHDFRVDHSSFILIAGTLGPLKTETRTFR